MDRPAPQLLLIGLAAQMQDVGIFPYLR
jgi:hypothetical protein